MKQASWFEALENAKVRCTLCPHNCQIAKEEEGLCRVRGNRDGILYALTYGKVVSAAIDPIEKKPLYHFYPGAQTLSLGSIGCNLHCLHCQNWQISQCDMQRGTSILQDLSPADAVAKAQAAKVSILVFTYNEPSLWFEYIRDTAPLARQQGIKIVLVTSGMINPDPLQELLPYIDAYRVDIKGFSHQFYKDLTGFDVLDQVLANTSAAFRAGAHVEVVTNLIPGWNDDTEQLTGLADWICQNLSPQLPWHLTRYIPSHRLHEPATPLATLEKAFQIGLQAGLEYVYLGNVPGHSSQQTCCSGCNELLIERSGYGVEALRLVAGSCPACKRRLEIYSDSQGQRANR